MGQSVNYHIGISTLIPLCDTVVQEEDSAVIRQALAETLPPLAAALLKAAGKCDSPEIQPAKAEIMTKCLKLVADLLVDDAPQVMEAACEALVSLAGQWEPQERIHGTPKHPSGPDPAMNPAGHQRARANNRVGTRT